VKFGIEGVVSKDGCDAFVSWGEECEFISFSRRTLLVVDDVAAELVMCWIGYVHVVQQQHHAFVYYNDNVDIRENLHRSLRRR
jgi:hypothetical protein